MVSKALFSKATDHWATPPDLYEKLNEEFEFDFDPCPLNAKHVEIWWCKKLCAVPKYAGYFQIPPSNHESGGGGVK